MNIVNKLTIKHLVKNKRRTIVTIIGITLSVAMIMAVATLGLSFQKFMQDSSREMEGNWHAKIVNVEYQYTDELQQNKYFEETMVSQKLGYAAFRESENSYKPYFYVLKFDQNSFDNMPVNLVEGRLPQNDEEVVISKHVLDDGGGQYKVGDTLTLDIGERIWEGEEVKTLGQNYGYSMPSEEGQEQIIHPTHKTFTICGIMERPGFENYSAPGYTIITYLDRNTLLPSDVVDVSMIAEKPTRELFTIIEDYYKGVSNQNPHLEYEYNSDLLRYYGILQNDGFQNTFNTFIAILIVIIMIGSVALIYNAFAISTSERTKQFGMLASVGATRKQKRRTIFFEAFLLMLIGIPLGIVAGIGVAWVALLLANPVIAESFTGMIRMTPHINVYVSGSAMLIAAVVSVITILLSAYIPAKRISKISAISAIRQSQNVKLKAKRVKTSKLSRKLFGFEGELALKNLKRSKRYRSTIFSLFISLVLFISVSSFTHYMSRSMDVLKSEQDYNYTIGLQEMDETEENALYQQIRGLEGVQEGILTKRLYGTVKIDVENIGKELLKYLLENNYIMNEYDPIEIRAGVITVDEAQFNEYCKSAGFNPDTYQDAVNPKAILVNKNASQVPDGFMEYSPLQLNGPLTITLNEDFSGLESEDGDGEEAQGSIELEIFQQTDQVPMSFSNEAGLFDLKLVVSNNVFRAIQEEWTTDEKFALISLQVEDTETFSPVVTKLLKDNYQADQFSTYDVDEIQRSNNAIIMVLRIFTYGFVGLITLIGATNIFNTISTNIALRRREFAMLKSVGMSPKSFNKMIRYESIFYGLKALLYGLPFSLLISYLIFKSLEGSISFGFTLPWINIVIAIAVVFLITFVTMIHSSRRIKKENILDALKEETA